MNAAQLQASLAASAAQARANAERIRAGLASKPVK